MRTHLASFLAPMAAVAAASSCTVGTIVGTDGSGASSGTTSIGEGGASSGTTWTGSGGGSSGTTWTGSGGVGGGTTWTGSGGAGGGTTWTGSGGAGGGTTWTGSGFDGGMDNGCAWPILTVMGDGSPKEYDFVCQGSEAGPSPLAAVGYIGYPGPHWPGPEQVWITGCQTPNGPSLQGGITLNAPISAVGSTTAATVTLDDGTDQYANSGTASLSITYMDALTIRGTYSADVQAANGNGVTNISGSFQVCRGADFLPP
jgi:hypothetical protein